MKCRPRSIEIHAFQTKHFTQIKTPAGMRIAAPNDWIIAITGSTNRCVIADAEFQELFEPSPQDPTAEYPRPVPDPDPTPPNNELAPIPRS